MKISKLFHWLYALLMLMPIFAIGGSMAFNVFNENSFQNTHETTETIIQKNIYETNDVSSANDLVVGNAYRLRFNDSENNSLYSYAEDLGYLEFEFTSVLYGHIRFNNTELDDSYLVGFPSLYDFEFHYYFYFDDDSFYCSYSMRFNNDSYVNFDIRDFDMESTDYVDFVLTYKSELVAYEMYDFIIAIPQAQLENYYYYEEIEITRNADLSQNFYIALDDFDNSPVFSWAKSSFLVEPIAYITDLFGLSSNSPFITMLSYWLSISIIWLCFDVIMYVPLLCHRWIDKGGLE